MDRRRLCAALLAFTSLALAIAGMVVWREMSPSIADLAARCSGRALLGCGFAYPPPHHLHPLRAELLWAAASITGLLAVGLTLRPHLARDRALTASA
jgi:hypothetical protein